MTIMHIDLKMGESLRIGGATVRLEKKSGQMARLRVIADADTKIVAPADRRAANTARMSALFDQGEHYGKHPL